MAKCLWTVMRLLYPPWVCPESVAILPWLDAFPENVKVACFSHPFSSPALHALEWIICYQSVNCQEGFSKAWSNLHTCNLSRNRQSTQRRHGHPLSCLLHSSQPKVIRIANTIIFTANSWLALETTPAISCPGTNGKGMGIGTTSLAKWTSEWQMPQYLRSHIKLSCLIACQLLPIGAVLDVNGHIIRTAGVPLDGHLGKLGPSRVDTNRLYRFHLGHICACRFRTLLYRSRLVNVWGIGFFEDDFVHTPTVQCSQ